MASDLALESGLTLTESTSLGSKGIVKGSRAWTLVKQNPVESIDTHVSLVDFIVKP